MKNDILMSRISTYCICVITLLLCCVPNYLGAQSTSKVGDDVSLQYKYPASIQYY